jgi:hypothetical protein
MRGTAEDLRRTIADVWPLLQKIADDEAAARPAAGQWSKKEILGHLIDSACNNQQKFVRTISAAHVDFAGYRQNQWIEAQQYNAAGWADLIDLWRAYNLHLARVIENAGAEVLSNTINIENAGTYTLEFIMKDYVEHLKHHLKQILPDAAVHSEFQNVYNT